MDNTIRAKTLLMHITVNKVSVPIIIYLVTNFTTYLIPEAENDGSILQGLINVQF